MKRRWKISFAVLAVTAFGIAGWYAPRPPEPAYQGKSLNEWYSRIRIPSDWRIDPYQDPALRAIAAMGKAAVPFVTRKLHGLNSPFHNRFVHWLDKVAGGEIDADKFRRASTCVFTLCADAGDAVPELIEVAKGSNPDKCSNAIYLLGWIHKRPDLSVPFLMEMAKSPDPLLRSQSVLSLMEFRSSAKMAVRGLVLQLPAESDPETRLSIVRFLGSLEGDSKLAVPMLISQYQAETNTERRNSIAGALRNINREAADKAGVKVVVTRHL